MSDLIDRGEELYRLTLDHYIVYDDDRFKIGEPLVVQFIVNRQFGNVPICLNRMMDMMRDELLKRAVE